MCCLFLLHRTRSISDTPVIIMIVVVLGAIDCLIQWRKKLVHRQIAECICLCTTSPSPKLIFFNFYSNLCHDDNVVYYSDTFYFLCSF